jgi:hypothetical protein
MAMRKGRKGRIGMDSTLPIQIQDTGRMNKVWQAAVVRYITFTLTGEIGAPEERIANYCPSAPPRVTSPLQKRRYHHLSHPHPPPLPRSHRHRKKTLQHERPLRKLTPCALPTLPKPPFFGPGFYTAHFTGRSRRPPQLSKMSCDGRERHVNHHYIFTTKCALPHFIMQNRQTGAV